MPNGAAVPPVPGPPIPGVEMPLIPPGPNGSPESQSGGASAERFSATRGVSACAEPVHECFDFARRRYRLRQLTTMLGGDPSVGFLESFATVVAKDLCDKNL